MRPSVTRLYLMNRSSCKFLVTYFFVAITTNTENKNRGYGHKFVVWHTNLLVPIHRLNLIGIDLVYFSLFIRKSQYNTTRT